MIALVCETALLWGLLGAWLAVWGKPGPDVQMALLAAAAGPMGCQSGVVRVAVSKSLSTTYFTGIFTGIVTQPVTGDGLQRRASLLVLTLPTGAVVSAALVTWARHLAPVLPALDLSAATTLYWWKQRPQAPGGTAAATSGRQPGDPFRSCDS